MEALILRPLYQARITNELHTTALMSGKPTALKGVTACQDPKTLVGEYCVVLLHTPSTTTTTTTAATTATTTTTTITTQAQAQPRREDTKTTVPAALLWLQRLLLPVVLPQLTRRFRNHAFSTPKQSFSSGISKKDAVSFLWFMQVNVYRELPAVLLGDVRVLMPLKVHDSLFYC